MNLHKMHASAHAKSQCALNVFRQIAEDLRNAAQQHQTVAVEANARIAELEELRFSAGEAADAAERQAKAVTALVGGA